MGSSVITPEDVLETMMNDGTIDAIRLKVIKQLKSDEELKTTTFTMVEQSTVLNTPGSEKQTKRELFDALRQELEAPALEKASKSVWELILDTDGIGKEINETVESVYCRLCGREPPLFPPSNSESKPENEKEKDNLEKEKENEKLDSLSKKRTFGEMSMQGGAVEVADGSSDPPSIPGDSVLDCRAAPCDDGNSLEPALGRCKRTDGKNWRCSKVVVPDHRYCEKHLHRGRVRSRKQVETACQVSTSPSNNIKDSKANLSTSSPGQVKNNNENKNSASNKSSNVSPRLSSSPKSALQDGSCKAESSS